MIAQDTIARRNLVLFDLCAAARGGLMSGLLDLFQWERFITPSIIKAFYALAVVIALLFGLSGIATGVKLLFLDPLSGVFTVFASLFGMIMAVLFARIVSEFVLILFRINEHLGAIRSRGGM
jgi:hypothetical protein